MVIKRGLSKEDKKRLNELNKVNKIIISVGQQILEDIKEDVTE